MGIKHDLLRVPSNFSPKSYPIEIQIASQPKQTPLYESILPVCINKIPTPSALDIPNFPTYIEPRTNTASDF